MEDHQLFTSKISELSLWRPVSDNCNHQSNYYKSQQFFQSPQCQNIYKIEERQPKDINFQDKQSLKPTYKEVIKTIIAIQSRFPHRSIQSIIQLIYTKITEPNKLITNKTDLTNGSPLISPNQTQYQFQKKRIIGTAFNQVGYGLQQLQNYLEHSNVNLKIDLNSYNNIINGLFLNAYKRLCKLLESRSYSYKFEWMEIKTTEDYNTLMDVMRTCRKQLQIQQINTLSILIKANYESGSQSDLSTISAGKLYQQLYRQVKRLRQYRIKHESNQRNNSWEQNKQTRAQSHQDIWTDLMTVSLINSYRTDPTSLPKISLSLKQQFSSSHSLLSNQNIKYQLQAIFRESVRRIQLQMESQKCLEMGAKFKRMLKLDEKRFSLILTCPEAVSVRIALCDFYLIESFDLDALVCTILCVNEFINLREHQQISKSLKVTKQQNSICRDQYEFAGKRRKVLVFKRKKRPREKPSYF